MGEFGFMELYSISLTNFRNYKEKTSLVFSKVTAIVGPNDSGKSTILQALDVFFNEKKITKNDFNIDALKEDKNCNIDIEVVFDNVPSRIVINSNISTSLKEEHLLDQEGRIHVIKRFFLNSKKNKSFICAYHPTNEGANDLLLLNNTELTQRITKLKIYEKNKKLVTNSEIRKKIWDFYENNLGGINYDFCLIPISSDYLINIYQEVKSFFPIFELFPVDRANSDIDNEIQDPLQIAIKSVFQKKSILDACEIISKEVTKEINKVAEGTRKIFHDLSSDFDLNFHSNLSDIKELKWTEVFKNVGLIDNNLIPLNQHGSGIRRLCILSFLIYSVERRAKEVSSNRSGERPPVIYAIEEPETSLHFDHQLKLINVLKNIDKNVNNLDRIIITTHSSNIVKRLDFSSIRIISNTSTEKKVSTVKRSVLPIPSLNEINYFVYGDISEGYHNELYGYLQSKSIEDDPKNFRETQFDKWLESHSNEIIICKKWERDDQEIKNQSKSKKQNKNKNKNKKYIQNCTLQTYIRNYYHHPENTLNDKYTLEELSKSIKQMISLALNL